MLNGAVQAEVMNFRPTLTTADSAKNPTHDHYSPTHSARKQSFLADPAGGGEDKQKKKRTGRDSFAGKQAEVEGSIKKREDECPERRENY